MVASSTLMLHAGARRVSLDELLQIPAPRRTASWVPIPHYRVLESVRSAVDGAAFKIKRMDLGVTHGGQKFFGVLDLTSTIIEGITLAVGVRNSTDKSLPAGIAAGERVLVCDNLAFSATIVVMRKHTVRIEQELDQRIISGISRLSQFQQASAGRIQRLQQAPINDAQAHDLIVRAVDNRCIGLRDLPKVLHEWREPSHEAFQPRTAWSLHNAFTEVAKERFQRNPTVASVGTIRLNRLFEAALN
jgi:hypothetical protein